MSEHSEERRDLLKLGVGGLDPVSSNCQDRNPVLLACIPHGRRLGETGSTHIHRNISEKFRLVGLLCFETQACHLNPDGDVSLVGRKVGRDRSFFEDVQECATGACVWGRQRWT